MQSQRYPFVQPQPVRSFTSTSKDGASPPASQRLWIRGLPLSTRTRDIYKTFSRLGNVTRITLHETSEGRPSGKAEITFEPPANWDRLPARVSFQLETGQRKLLTVELSNDQRRNFTVSSPVRKDVKYDEKITLTGCSLDFGVLQDQESMIIMGSRGTSELGVKLVLDLKRLEIEISFPSVLKSGDNIATRTFRFLIALDDDFMLWHVAADNAYVLHVPRPPWYSKQLREAIYGTHSDDAKYWSTEDTWARQTDIFRDKVDIHSMDKSPVSLQKNFNAINIARWTTFKFNLGLSQGNEAKSVFSSALLDFNVTVKEGKSFNFHHARPSLDEDTWDLINDVAGDAAAQRFGDQPLNAKLPFSVRYQLEVCISQGWISEYSITSDFLKQLSAWPEAKAKQALVYVDSQQRRMFDPMDLFRDIQYSKPVQAKKLPEHCIEIYSATVTATSILFHTPSVEITNRVVRKYKPFSHRFLRVRFEDDDYRGRTRIYPSANNKMVMLFRRIKRVMHHGIKLGDMVYEFVAWGNSQLREHGAYFFAAIENVSADTIRANMGFFDHERVVAKRAARMGQCFSTTKPVILRLPAITDSNTIPDIVKGKYNFTDGVGKISEVAASIVSHQLGIKGPTPSLFQFRLGGCKGVLAIDPELKTSDIKVRRSQLKFNSPSAELEIIRWSEFWQPYLNRQLILCLSSLGVANEVFIRKQDDAIRSLDNAMVDDGAAIQALRENIDPNMMTLNICELVEARFRKRKEPFVLALLQLWRAWSLKYLKEKAKIPVTQGAFVMGCVDETNTLSGHENSRKRNVAETDRVASQSSPNKHLPEIFVQIKDPKTGEKKIIEGICVVARNPSLHRGDIRVVMARNVPKLHHMCDVVVFSQKGDRDLPSMCSGGDLDGDDYVVIWDTELIPKEWNAEPFHYEAPPPKLADGDITTSNMIDFFHDYMQNDALGRIAIAHMGAADKLDDGLDSAACLQLLELHSTAVDYPKTGVPARMTRALERSEWPHFMEKRGKKYTSQKVLGKLYDAVERVRFKPKYATPFDERILGAGEVSETLFERIEEVKYDWDNALNRLMAQRSIKTEFEVWSTFVLDHSKASKDYKFQEEVGQLSKSLKEQYYERLCDVAGGRDFDHLAPVAVAAYKYTNYQVQLALHEIEQGSRPETPDAMPFISFPWLLQETLVRIANFAGHEACPQIEEASVEDRKVIPGEVDLQKANDGSVIGELTDIAELCSKDHSGLQHLTDPYKPPTDRGGTKDLSHDEQAGTTEPVDMSAALDLPRNFTYQDAHFPEHSGCTDTRFTNGGDVSSFDGGKGSMNHKGGTVPDPAKFADLTTLEALSTLRNNVDVKQNVARDSLPTFTPGTSSGSSNSLIDINSADFPSTTIMQHQNTIQADLSPNHNFKLLVEMSSSQSRMPSHSSQTMSNSASEIEQGELIHCAGFGNDKDYSRTSTARESEALPVVKNAVARNESQHAIRDTHSSTTGVGTTVKASSVDTNSELVEGIDGYPRVQPLRDPLGLSKEEMIESGFTMEELLD